MYKEVEELLNKLGEMEDAPLIWINKKIYDQAKKNDDLQNRIDKAIEYIDDRISVLTVSIDNKAKDQYFNNKCIGGVQELKHIRRLLKGENNE